jgi:hypothetical protein
MIARQSLQQLGHTDCAVHQNDRGQQDEEISRRFRAVADEEAA